MRRLGGLCGAALGALAMMGPAQGAPSPSTPASTSPTVTVTAPPVQDVPALVRKFGRVESGGRLARWESQACPVVLGDLPPAFRDLIAARIRQADAAAVGMKVGAHCSPNIVIVVMPHAQDVAEKLAARRRRLFSGGKWPVDQAKLAAWTADDHPVRVWHVSRTVQSMATAADDTDVPTVQAALLGSPGLDTALPFEQFGNVLPSRLTPSGTQAFQHELVIVDRDRISGLTAGQVSAYLAMVTLAEVRPDADLGNVDTIMNLFADQKAGRPEPGDLTFWDRAYLQGLYRTESQSSRTMQDAVMGDHIRAEIVAHNVLPLSSTEARTGAPPSP